METPQLAEKADELGQQLQGTPINCETNLFTVKEAVFSKVDAQPNFANVLIAISGEEPITGDYVISLENEDGVSVLQSPASNNCENGTLLVGITSTDGMEITIKYADEALVNRMKTFDLNWILPNEIEGYDFAAGDITRLFASIGCMGKQSRLLMTEIVSKNNYGLTEHYSMSYIRNSQSEITVRVDVYYNGTHTSYSIWDIRCLGSII